MQVIFNTNGDSIFLSSLHRTKGGAFGKYSESYVTPLLTFRIITIS